MLEAENKKTYEQIDLFIDYHQKEVEQQEEKKERNLQKAMINIKEKYGKNAIIKAMNLQEAGTTIDRNNDDSYENHISISPLCRHLSYGISTKREKVSRTQ